MRSRQELSSAAEGMNLLNELFGEIESVKLFS